MVNDFGGMPDQDDGEEYFHAKSSLIKGGRRMDNQVCYRSNQFCWLMDSVLAVHCTYQRLP